MRNIKSSKFNERLGGAHSLNWENLHLPIADQVSAQYETILGTPIIFTMKNGQVSDIVISITEPQWSLNVKKSLISLIKIQTDNEDFKKSLNIVRLDNETNKTLPDSWKVMEQGVDGRCENNYQFTKLPEYMIHEIYSDPKLPVQKCASKNVYHITKTRDVTKCTERAAFQENQPGRYLCQTGNCDSMWQRSSFTRYIGCGTSLDDVELLVINNEGEIIQNVLAYKTETVLMGSRQELMIKDVRNQFSYMPAVDSSKTIDNLLYEFTQSVGLRGNSIFPEPRPQTHQHQTRTTTETTTTTTPFSTFTTTTAKTVNERQMQQRKDESYVLDSLAAGHMISQIMEEIFKVANDLKKIGNEKPIAPNVMSIVKVFSLLSTEHMQTLYTEVETIDEDSEDKENARQLLLELAIVSGTNPAIMFLKDMIIAGKFNPLRTAEIISSIPHYIKTPNLKVLEEIFELIKSPEVSRHEMLKYNAEIAFATVVNRACISPFKDSRFPTFVFGEFCNNQAPEISTKYIPYFVNQLQSSSRVNEKITALLALGTLGHESVIPILLPYIEGKVANTPSIVQQFAIWGLHNVQMHHKDVLLPIYSAIVFNPTKERSVRIAALTMMLKLNPSMASFQKLATSTWFEKDPEFSKFIYQTLKSLNDLKISELPVYEDILELVNKAKIVFPHVKPAPGVSSSVNNKFMADWLDELQVGYVAHGSYSLRGNTQYFFGKLEYYLDQLKFSPVEIGVNIENAYKLAGELFDIFQLDSYGKGTNRNWKKMFESLNYQSEDMNEFVSGAWVRIFNDIHLISDLNKNSFKPIIDSIKETILKPWNLKQKLCGYWPINFIKVNNWMPTEILLPSDMGLPVLIEAHMPNVMSVTGNINVDCSHILPSVSIDLKTKVSTSFSGYAGTICPFSKEIIAVGIEENWAVNIPLKLGMGVGWDNFKLSVTTGESTENSTEIHLLSYSVKPFASIKPLVFLDFTPISSHENTKIIHSSSQLKQYARTVGDSIGLDLKFELNTESDYLDIESFLNHIALYKYNPVNMALFGWTHTALKHGGLPSCRYHEVKISHLLQTADPKTLDMTVYSVSGIKEAKELNFRQQSLIITQTPLLLFEKLTKEVDAMNIDEGAGRATQISFSVNKEFVKALYLTASSGFKKNKFMWNARIEDEQTNQEICSSGSVGLPFLPLIDSKRINEKIEGVNLQHSIGFGRSCDHKIHSRLRLWTFDEQTDSSRSSESFRKCQHLKAKVVEQEEKFLYTNSIADEQNSGQILVKYELEREAACQKSMVELTTFDRLQLNITHDHSLLSYYHHYLPASIKRQAMIKNQEEDTILTTEENRIGLGIDFWPSTRAIKINVINGKNDENKPEFDISPMAYSTNSDVLSSLASLKTLTDISSPMEDECTIQNSVVKTFNSKSYAYDLDDCLHVLSSDCSDKHSYAILAKTLDDRKSIIIYAERSQVEIAPLLPGSDYDIKIDNQKVVINPNQYKSVYSWHSGLNFDLSR